MSIRVDETKLDIEAAEPAIPTTCSPEDLPDEELLYDLADLFKVFSDTTRIKILYALMGRELCVADIAEATETSQSAVSHQLRTLKQSHLVKFRRRAQYPLLARRRPRLHHAQPRHEPHLRIATNHGTSAA